MVRAVTFDAASTSRAIELVRVLAVADRCELWADGCYLCSLTTFANCGRKWVVISLEQAAGGGVLVDPVAARSLSPGSPD